jgi:putative transposase
LQYHIVWCTKYRRKVLKDGVDSTCKELLHALAEEYRFEITAMEVMPDHIHLLVNATPQFRIPEMIKILKGGIGRPPKDLEQLQAYHRQVTGNDTSGDDAGK